MTVDPSPEELAAEIEELRVQRARLLEDKRKTADKDATATREGVAAEVTRLREEESARVEARRREIAEQVEKARVDAENSDRKEREKLAIGLEEAHNLEIAHAKWRIDGHDKRFADLNGSVEKLAGAVEEQTRATRDLRQEMRDSFADQERAALKRALAVKDKAEEVEVKAVQAAKESKAESRKLLYQFAGVILAALIAALAAIIVAVI